MVGRSVVLVHVTFLDQADISHGVGFSLALSWSSDSSLDMGWCADDGRGADEGQTGFIELLDIGGFRIAMASRLKDAR